jgi:hypothetical protein
MSQFSRRRQQWTRPKHADRKLPALDLLEYRQTVSDTFFVSLQAAGVSLLGAIAVERARDPFGLTNPLDISISGGSDRPPVPVHGGQGASTLLSAVVAGNAQPDSSRVGGIGRAGLEEPTGRPSESKTNDAAASDFADGLPVVLDSAVDEPAPRSHGVIRKLKLAPPASVVGASTTFTADTATPSPSGAQFEIPQPVEAPAAREAVPAPPARPIIPATANGGDSKAPSVSTNAAAIVASRGASAPGSTAPSTGHSTNPGADALRLATIDGTDIAGSDNMVSSQAAGSTFGSGGVIPCPITTSPGQSGGGPIGTSCEPQMLLSSSSLPVLNWESNHGLVMFPGVIEYDQPLQWVDLRSTAHRSPLTSFLQFPASSFDAQNARHWKLARVSNRSASNVAIAAPLEASVRQWDEANRIREVE